MKLKELKNKVTKQIEKINLTSFTNKVTKQVKKLDLEKVKKKTTKHGIKATTNALNFATKIVERINEKFQGKETEKVSKDKKQRKRINRTRNFPRN